MGKKRAKRGGWGGHRPNAGAKPRHGEVAGRNVAIYLYADHVAAISRISATLAWTRNEAVRRAIMELDERVTADLARKQSRKRG